MHKNSLKKQLRKLLQCEVGKNIIIINWNTNDNNYKPNQNNKNK